MNAQNILLNRDTTHFLDAAAHPLRQEIEHLRKLVLDAAAGLTESVKWNAPNYSIGSLDCITMKIFPPKNIQLVFHRGAVKKMQPAERLIQDDSGLLDWKANDRAVATFNNSAAISKNEEALKNIITQWVAACIANQ
ncbi:DUF1801 domain-containing protein [Paracnuella aquatica]|uniref:DUF1801 domain-containing protein n=1 Tax=Paracnuella aquatica TaxID=2268757 RepID=UPI000DEFA9DA|nr:DUF1801 domain-containing protein [Paracnuella aquatica]RPD43483.1 DUF1801 domain-containing protein [Paracnuella aquatica]